MLPFLNAFPCKLRLIFSLNTVKNKCLYLYFQVSEDDYKNCSLTSRDEILRCNRPTSTKMFTIDIVQYNAIPGSIEFKCGQQHYFIGNN